MLASLGVVINASSILILYLLVYTLFYKYKTFENNVHSFDDYTQMNDSRLKNLVDDINHNDQILKNSLS
jgi:trehalose-6-phosphate synthase